MSSVHRLPTESWRQCAERYGRTFNLEEDVLALFDRLIKEDYSADDACLDACVEWDVADL